MTREQVIPDAAVEAAAVAMEDASLSLIGRDLGTMYRNDIARAALEAATPHLLQSAKADAWDECLASDTGWINPYRKDEVAP